MKKWFLVVSLGLVLLVVGGYVFREELEFTEVVSAGLGNGNEFRLLRERYTTEASYAGKMEIYQSGRLIHEDSSIVLLAEQENFQVTTFREGAVILIYDDFDKPVGLTFVLDFEKDVFFEASTAKSSARADYQEYLIEIGRF